MTHAPEGVSRTAGEATGGRVWRPEALDWVAAGFVVLGVAAVLSGLLPLGEAAATVRRILPLLVFLGFVVVLAELAARAEVFDVVAARAAIAARGNYAVLFVCCVSLAATTTAFLNLDTTAVLLTPVMLALARVMRVPPVPLAMTTVWLANTASLLLPVSNLTNLLAMDRIGLGPAQFAARMWPSQLASVGATALCLWVFYWRRGRRGADRFGPPPPHRPRDVWLFRLAAGACAAFVVLIFVGIPLAWTTAACAGAVLLGFVLRDRASLSWTLVPVRLLAFVTGLFLVVQAVSRLGLDDLLRAMLGADDGVAGTLRAAATGAAMSNLVNNLPSYVAGEAAVSATHRTQLLGLLIGTNAGPVIMPWASLATLLWYERCRAAGVAVSWRGFVAAGAVAATLSVAAAAAALLVTRG